jgi:hypothetical protein
MRAPEPLGAWRMLPRCAGCGRRLSAALTEGYSHRPPLRFCPRCALRRDLERGVPS